ncbi:ACT-like superfamily protein isoform 1 [Hibiscus syriacus]|uniref:ACT-like superfamily protein isoform 1 n=1 Tax=Hibiscus syriacus TaxID=106335 RepID=A0A6A2X9A8_HIBSY|nr:ACT-like superfamily protein isoform 1 [Hibiscus syriacus]
MVVATPGYGATMPNPKSLACLILRGPWLMVFGSLLIMSAAGATYMFSLYSGDIKKSLGYDQTTLNLLSFFKDLGTNVGVLSGLIAEVTPPWFVLSVGAVLNFFGAAMVLFLLFLPLGVVIMEEYKLWEARIKALNDSPLKLSSRSRFRSGVGGTLTAIDNLGQIGGSLGYPKRSISTFVSLASNAHLHHAPSCVGHLLIAFNVPGGLHRIGHHRTPSLDSNTLRLCTISAAATLFGTVVSLTLAIRTRKFIRVTFIRSSGDVKAAEKEMVVAGLPEAIFWS